MGDMLSIEGTQQRAASNGINVSKYALRQWVRSGAIPARKAGRLILLYWPNVEAFLTCKDGKGDFTLPPVAETGSIRPLGRF